MTGIYDGQPGQVRWAGWWMDKLSHAGVGWIVLSNTARYAGKHGACKHVNQNAFI